MPADTHRQLVTQAATLLHKYFAQLSKHLGGGAGGARAAAVEPVDDGPAPERKCFNRHPQCEAWATKVGWAAV